MAVILANRMPRASLQAATAPDRRIRRVPLTGAGWIEVVTGSMFSGKTSELIRRLRLCLVARKNVQIFKSHRDDRYNDTAVVSHDGFELAGQPVRGAQEILSAVLPNTHVIGVDEAQFFGPELIPICETLAKRGLRVVVAGLDMDFRGEPFEVMAQLMARAELVTKNLAICSVCGQEAHYSQLLTAVKKGQRIVVGAKDRYEARCRNCFIPPR